MRRGRDPAVLVAVALRRPAFDPRRYSPIIARAFRNARTAGHVFPARGADDPNRGRAIVRRWRWLTPGPSPKRSSDAGVWGGRSDRERRVVSDDGSMEALLEELALDGPASRTPASVPTGRPSSRSPSFWGWGRGRICVGSGSIPTVNLSEFLRKLARRVVTKPLGRTPVWE